MMTSAPARSEAAQIKHLVRDAAKRLLAAGIDSPRLDAELLFACAAGVTREDLFAASIVSDDALRERYAALVELRASRMPLAYIVGRREFYSLEIEVSPEVLIPRPETETLVAAALELLASRPAAAVIDIGTGSGAIALAIAANAPRTRVVATDISAGALEIAARNAVGLGLASRLEFRRADCWQGLDDGEPLGRFDLVVANPPYIREAEIDSLAPEIREFEPRQALAGGPDGLDLYRRIAADAPRHLARQGVMIVEVGEGQAGDVAAIFSAAGFGEIAILKDLAGISRVVQARLS